MRGMRGACDAELYIARGPVSEWQGPCSQLGTAAPWGGGPPPPLPPPRWNPPPAFQILGQTFLRALGRSNIFSAGGGGGDYARAELCIILHNSQLGQIA